MVATAQTAGTSALAIAVVVKLTRVVLLAPVAAAAGGVHQRILQVRKRSNGTEGAANGVDGRFPPIVPLFVIGFLSMVAVRSLGWAPVAGLEIAAAVQDILLATALFGLGSAVRVRT